MDTLRSRDWLTTFDLSGLRGRLRNVEVFDFHDGSATSMNIEVADVLRLNETGNFLALRGTAADSVSATATADACTSSACPGPTADLNGDGCIDAGEPGAERTAHAGFGQGGGRRAGGAAVECVAAGGRAGGGQVTARLVAKGTVHLDGDEGVARAGTIAYHRGPPVGCDVPQWDDCGVCAEPLDVSACSGS